MHTGGGSISSRFQKLIISSFGGYAHGFRKSWQIEKKIEYFKLISRFFTLSLIFLKYFCIEIIKTLPKLEIFKFMRWVFLDCFVINRWFENFKFIYPNFVEFLRSFLQIGKFSTIFNPKFKLENFKYWGVRRRKLKNLKKFSKTWNWTAPP